MKKHVILPVLAGVIFATSFFLPAYANMTGFECLLYCVGTFTGKDPNSWGNWFYDSGFVVSNLLFVLLIVASLRTARFPRAKIALATIVLLDVLSWLVLSIIYHEPEQPFPIQIGYYLWLLSYVLLLTVLIGGKHRLTTLRHPGELAARSQRSR